MMHMTQKDRSSGRRTEASKALLPTPQAERWSPPPFPGQCADIAGGDEAAPHSRPYMAALVRGDEFLCGGTLIRRNLVLTAATCTVGRGDRVVLGAHSRNRPEEGKQEFLITNVYVHPQYDKNTFDNDVKILQLNKEADLNQYVQTLPLPTTDDDVTAGTQCLVAGWGTTGNESPASDTLREVNITAVDRNICRKYYRRVTNNMVCAGGNNQRRGSCSGDSGGPLICGGVQRGITSFGPLRCDDPQIPGVYARLTKDTLEWINKIVFW